MYIVGYALPFYTNHKGKSIEGRESEGEEGKRRGGGGGEGEGEEGRKR